LEFGILGPLEVRDGDRMLALGALGERSLLALMLLNANELVPTERLVDELWGERPPKTAVKTIQVYVSRLRRLLGTETIVTRAPGYVVNVDPDRLDLHRFERLAADGRTALAAGDALTAARRLRAALAMWRGAPLSDFAYEPFAHAAAARLDELRLEALQERIEADLRCGRAGELVGELQGLVARHPLRERLRAQLMLALYRTGRQAEALDVYRDTRSTLVEELGIEPSRELRDLERAVLAQDPSLQRPGARATPRAAGIFVGRETELRVALSALEQAQAGCGSVVLLSGEPGIGKSRLADEVAAHARDGGLRVLRGRCWEAGGAPAYWPWLQVLRAGLRGAKPAQVRRHVGGGAPELAELLPELLELLGELPRPAVRDPEAQRFRLFDAVGAFLAAMSEERPLLLVLDDLHAADESSLLLLQFVTGTVAENRLVLVGAYRDTEVGPGHPLERLSAELARDGGVTRIAMDGLSRADVAAYVQLSTGTAAPAGLVEAIHRRTLGNPLFVGETVRLLASEGSLEGADLATAVAAGVQEAVARRLERLQPAAREALLVASVLGDEFDPGVLERLVTDDPADALDAAVAARLVGAAAGAPGLLCFSHSLVRDALYEAIPSRGRRELHRRVAEVLERRHAAEPSVYAAVLAHHFFQAGATEEAAGYARLAAERAGAQLAYEEAARLYRLAIRALERGETLDEPRLCELLLALGDVLSRAGDDPEAKRTFLRAAEVARRGGMAEQLGLAALGYAGRWVWTVMRGDPHVIPLLEEALAVLPDEDSALRARLLARLAAGPLKVQGDASRARRFAMSADAVAMARRLGDPALLAWALDGRKVAIWGPDTLEEHWAVMDELARLAREAGEPEQLVDAHVCALIKLFERFEIERFDQLHARATTAADELCQPGQRWLVAVMAPMHALLVGRLDDAERLIDEAFVLGREAIPWNARVSQVMQRFVFGALRGELGAVEPDLRTAAAENPWYPTLQAALAALYAELGDSERARAAFELLAGDDFASVPTDDEWLLTTALLADACCFLGDPHRTALVYRRLEPYAHRIVVGPLEACLGSAARPLGKLAGTLGRTEDAAHWLERAATANEGAGALPWAAHARREEAEILLSSGDHAAAAPLLERAEAGYRALGMGFWAGRCQATAATSLLA
jgi:DNA-binding SARP family transcriptional activator